MRCKVHCNFKLEQNGGVHIAFSPVYSGSLENEQFFKQTPGGTVTFHTLNVEVANKFEVGKEYYIDFTPAF